MFVLRDIKLCYFVPGILLACLLMSGSALAAPVTSTFDFTLATINTPTAGAGNEWIFQDTGGGTQTATVTSWAEVGAGSLEAATGHQMTNGMGVCNSLETNCLNKDNIRGITEALGKDWILITFSENVNLIDVTLFPETGSKNKAQWRDVTYFTGSLSGSIAGATYADLTGALGLTEYSVVNGKGLTAVTVDINAVASGEVWGNSILIGGTIGGNGADRILLNGMTTVVPLPAAVWLFMSALGALATRRKLTQKPM